jgi:energy-converting hydrogenase Eha subunit C
MTGLSAAPPQRVPAVAWLGLGLLAAINAVAYVDRVAIALLLEPI